MALMESFSGIRGIYGTELTEEITRRYAIVYSKFLKEHKLDKKTDKKPDKKQSKEKSTCIVIGRDTRQTGNDLKRFLIESCDCNIIDVGVLPTATIEFAVRHYKADGGIIITASHNEPEYNGFKILDENGAVMNPKDISRIIDEVHKLNDIKLTSAKSSSEKGTEKRTKEITKKRSVKNGHLDALEAYCSFVTNLLSDKEKKELEERKIKIVVDPNGGTGTISKKIFDKMGIKAVYLNMNEGEFKRKVEPTKDSLSYLINQINDLGCEFAAGFDCDADRVEIILLNGNLVSGNKTLAIIAKQILSEKNNLNSSIVVNDATSYVVKEAVKPYGAKWIEVEVGETNVVNAMLKVKAPIGGEGSNGGIIIPPSRCRDGIITLIYLFKAMIKSNKTLPELLSDLPEYFYQSKKLVLTDDFANYREKVKSYYIKKGYKVLESGDETGGIKVLKDDSWVWFRQSKTEDKILRIIVDTKKEALVLKLMDEAASIVK
jgi:phosphomannomutase